MSNKKTGGPAFPRRLTQVENSYQFDEAELKAQSGMTLRDYFAAKSMASMMVRGDEYKNAHARKLMGEMAYAIADAMLAARKDAK